MIQRIAVLLAGAAWAFLLFLCTGWLTFPGDAVSQRVVYEVGKSSRGSYQLELGDLSPWWVGMKTDSVKVYGKADGTGVNPLLAIATDAGLRTVQVFHDARRWLAFFVAAPV